MKSLYDDNDCYTPEATILNNKIRDILKPIFIEYADMQYPARDIKCVALDAIDWILLVDVMIDRRMKSSLPEEQIK